MTVASRPTTLGLACLAMLLACRGPAVVRYEEALERTPAPSAHAVHEDRLATLMREVDRLRDERLPQAIDPRAEQARQAREIARVATAMAESAARIPAARPPGLDPAREAELRELAAAFEQASRRLAEDAPRLSPRGLRARLAEIDATCDRCHGRFRIPGVDGGGR